MGDPRLYHILETDYNGTVRLSVVHLFDWANELVWSRYNEHALLKNPHEELLNQLTVGNEAMGRLLEGEFSENDG